MLITGFPTGALAANCYVVAPEPGGPGIVIDSGMDTSPTLERLLAEHGVTPLAVVLTHGHIDHSYDAAAVSSRYGIPVYLHPADRAQLTDPWSALGVPRELPVLERTEFREPADLRPLSAGRLSLAGLDLIVHETPGHTPGSVAIEVAGVLFSGDFLFAGSIGRMDFPGGSESAMYESLATVAGTLDEDVEVHPGHGPSTTIGHERAHNPYLRMTNGIAQ